MGRMLGVLAEIHCPMPAALAFLAVGFGVAERYWKLASYEVAGEPPQKMIRPEGTMETATQCPATSPPSRRDGKCSGTLPDTPCLANFRLCLRHEHTRSRLELQDRLDAAAANCWMRGVLADVHFPMPADGAIFSGQKF